MRFIELFAGIGGFSLGFERAGMECVGHVEIDPYAQKVLLKHWPDVPLMEDVKNVKGTEFGKVDLLCGGFPCQDLSVAGKQAGIKGKRSGLYDEIIRIAGVCRPKYIVLENVANILSRTDWFGYVLGRIAEIGYNAEWEIISAADVGAPHLRKRIWIVAHPKGLGSSRKGWSKNGGNARNKAGRDKMGDESFNRGKTIPDPDFPGLEGKKPKGGGPGKSRLPSKCDWWAIEPELGRMANGVPSRVDRLKCLGNALVPQIAEFIGKRLMEIK